MNSPREEGSTRNFAARMQTAMPAAVERKQKSTSFPSQTLIKSVVASCLKSSTGSAILKTKLLIRFAKASSMNPAR